jgi:small GTP-binding protein
VHDIENKFMLWNTTSQERDRSIAESYYRGMFGSFLVFDVTSRISFEAITGHWRPSTREHVNESVPVVIVGNKADLNGEALGAEATVFAEENDCVVYFTSAKTGDGIRKCLQELANQAIAARPRISDDSGANVNTRSRVK